MDTLDLKYLFNDMDKAEPNPQYENYLTQHIGNVKKGYEWLKKNLPDVLDVGNYYEETTYYGELDEIIANHDKSKYTKLPDANEYYDLKCEYYQYADYFYGEKTPEVEKNFNYAWLAHIHANPHHWQHWMLQNDEDGLILLDMPYVFTIEMICDWWAFSWKQNNLYEIFNWYEKNKEGILLSDKSRENVEMILNKLRAKLDADKV
jgi:hypothetical protein